MYLSFNHNLEVMKNTTYIENVFGLMQLHIFSLSQKSTLAHITKKNRVLLKRGVLLGPQISDFG